MPLRHKGQMEVKEKEKTLEETGNQILNKKQKTEEGV